LVESVRVIEFEAGEWFDDARFGSHGFSVTAVGDAAAVRMNVLRLNPGGVVGEHPAVGQQLLIMLSGVGTVGTPTEGPFEIAAGQAVLFEPGELHTTRTAVGMVALAIEGQLDID
jgi:quercetin dioxygenase-like cupin family protein